MNPTNHGSALISRLAIDRYRTSSDASHFYLVPQGVATPKNVNEVAELFKYATENQTSVTLRSGGTSLSGQSVSDAILIDTRRNFRFIEVLRDGVQIKVQPGASVRAVNARLARFGRKLGPDPASEIACTIGGVIANNSSGMACGINDNTYHTLESATVVLYNGAIINTADQNCDAQLQRDAPELYNTLNEIKQEINAKPEIVERIRRQYLIKNTMGYGLNSFIDFDSISEIFLHLLIGSEGTLGFIAEAIFNTLPLLSKAATTLLIFENLISATQALERLEGSNPATIELMDAASLRVGKIDLGQVVLQEHAALLVEYQAVDEVSLQALVSLAQPILNSLQTVNSPQLNSDPIARAALWHIRKGLYAAVAGNRKSGTTALLEDIAVPVSELASTCLNLQKLFAQYGYDDAVIFGHAKDGNIHFLINEDFRDPERAERYRLFTEDMVDLILAKGGSLKAEHGTGRMMAPFVERQYGSELYALMVRVKSAFDPSGVLNPGVIISYDALAHLHHIKLNPTIESIADNCVECGYCEPICPSKDLTTTPRQRIVIRRALASAKNEKNNELYQELVKSSEYHVEDTCAVDGLCENSCPVGINTGSLVTTLRSQRSEGVYSTLWDLAANNWGNTVKGIGSALTIASYIPTAIIEPINRSLRDLLGANRIPLWSKDLPRGGVTRTAQSEERADFVLFTSCLGSIFDSDTARSIRSLSGKAGVKFAIPGEIANLCCGTPWKSKGLTDGYATMVAKTYSALVGASDNGRIPIVCENSSCSEGLIQAIKDKTNSPLKILDAVDFAAEFLLPKLRIPRKLNSVALHPTCSSTQLGSNANFEALAHALSREVTIPTEWGCCAFAGDRGLLHPELTASATKSEAISLKREEFDAYLSTNLTCEIGMSRATGQSYQHILYQLDRLSETKMDQV